MDNDNLTDSINSLLNRQFEITAIKEHLISSGYSSEQVDAALQETLAARTSKQQQQVSKEQGFRGFMFIISGGIILLSILVFRFRSNNETYNVIRVILGLFSVVFGIILATRPLKDE